MHSGQKTFHFRRKSDRRSESSSTPQSQAAANQVSTATFVKTDEGTCVGGNAPKPSSAGGAAARAPPTSEQPAKITQTEQSNLVAYCERISYDLPQEVRLLRLCERIAILALDDFRHRLVAPLDTSGKSSSLERIDDDELRCCIAVYERAVSGFLANLEQRFVTPNRLVDSRQRTEEQVGAGDPLDNPSFATVNALLERRCRPSSRNDRLARSLRVLAELEARYDQEISSWEHLQSSMSNEILFHDDSWDAQDSSPDISAETEAIRHEINEHRLRDLEDLLLRLDKLERSMQRLHARYQAADQFCLETARKMNAIAFDGLVDLGEVRKLLTTATQSSYVEHMQT